MNIWLRADGQQNVSKIKEHIQSLCRVATRHFKRPGWLKTQSYKRNTDRKPVDLLNVGLISHIWLATHGWCGGLWLGGNQGPTGWGSTEIPGWALDYFAKCTQSQNHRMKPSGASCPFKLKGHTHAPSKIFKLGSMVGELANSDPWSKLKTYNLSGFIIIIISHSLVIELC